MCDAAYRYCFAQLTADISIVRDEQGQLRVEASEKERMKAARQVYKQQRKQNPHVQIQVPKKKKEQHEGFSNVMHFLRLKKLLLGANWICCHASLCGCGQLFFTEYEKAKHESRAYAQREKIFEARSEEEKLAPEQQKEIQLPAEKKFQLATFAKKDLDRKVGVYKHPQFNVWTLEQRHCDSYHLQAQWIFRAKSSFSSNIQDMDELDEALAREIGKVELEEEKKGDCTFQEDVINNEKMAVQLADEFEVASVIKEAHLEGLKVFTGDYSWKQYREEHASYLEELAQVRNTRDEGKIKYEVKSEDSANEESKDGHIFSANEESKDGHIVIDEHTFHHSQDVIDDQKMYDQKMYEEPIDYGENEDEFELNISKKGFPDELNIHQFMAESE